LLAAGKNVRPLLLNDEGISMIPDISARGLLKFIYLFIYQDIPSSFFSFLLTKIPGLIIPRSARLAPRARILIYPFSSAGAGTMNIHYTAHSFSFDAG